MSAPDVSLTQIPHMGRATVIGALIGALVVAVPVAVLVYYSGGNAVSILAGMHVGFFGGMGFGGMLGAVLQAERFTAARQRLADNVLNVTPDGPPSHSHVLAQQAS